MTVSVALSAKSAVSLTRKLNDILVSFDTVGAVNVAKLALPDFSSTFGPDVCLHSNVIGSPSGS